MQIHHAGAPRSESRAHESLLRRGVQFQPVLRAGRTAVVGRRGRHWELWWLLYRRPANGGILQRSVREELGIVGRPVEGWTRTKSWEMGWPGGVLGVEGGI